MQHRISDLFTYLFVDGITLLSTTYWISNRLVVSAGSLQGTSLKTKFDPYPCDIPQGLGWSYLTEGTLWWTNILPWKITIFNGKIHYKWPFSIAMLVHQRVSAKGDSDTSKHQQTHIGSGSNHRLRSVRSTWVWQHQRRPRGADFTSINS